MMPTAAAERPALGSRQTSLPGSARGQGGETALQRRHRLRRKAGELLGGRHRNCGRRVPGGFDAGVAVYRSDTGACYVGNVETCGSVWACPVCAAKVAARRADQLTEIAAAHAETGGGLAFLTLTQRHHARQKVHDLRRALMDGWAHLTSGRHWADLKRDFGLVGFVRVVEVTHGRNGWHPHVHALLFFDRELSPAELRRVRRKIYVRWARRLRGDVWNRGRRAYVRGSRPAPDYAHGCDLSAADPADAATVSRYLAKWGAGMELSGAAMKAGRGGNRTPFQLLNAADQGDTMAGVLFKSYVRAFRGARHLAISPSLRRLYGAELEDDDQAAAEQPELGRLQNGDSCGLVGHVDRDTWAEVVDRELTAEFCEKVSAEGFDGMVTWLADTYGLSVRDPNRGEWVRQHRRQPTPEEPIRLHRERVVAAAEAEWRALTPAAQAAILADRRAAILEKHGVTA